MIDFDGAQIYFGGGNHYKAAIWSGFSATHRRGAIASARRVLTRALGRKLKDNELPYKEGDRLRDEYAIYEQALWMLEHGQIADATGNDPVPVLTGAPEPNVMRTAGAGLYAPEALRWLGVATAAVIRG